MSLPSLRERYPTQYGEDPVVESYSRVRDCHDESAEVWIPYLTYRSHPYADEESEEEYAQAEALIKGAWLERGVVVTFADLGLPAGEQNAEVVLPILSRLPDALASAILDSVIE